MVNQGLIKYIKTEEAQGYTPKQLKDVLLKEGWPEKDIDDAIKYANQKNIFPSQDLQKKQAVKQRPTSITVIAILYFIIAGLGLLNGIYTLLMGESALLTGGIINTNPAIIAIIGTFIAIISIVIIIISLFNALIGWGLWTLKNWARIIAIIQIILSMLTIVGIPIAAIFLVFLIKKSTKEAFT